MELKQEKKTGTLKYILLCVFAGLVLAVGAAIRTVYGASIVTAFEHDKLYKDYKESNPITGEPLSETGEDFEFLAENELYTISYRITAPWGATTYPELWIERKSDKSHVAPWLSLSAQLLDGNEELMRFAILSPEIGYYDPYDNQTEATVWAEISEDKIIIKCLAIESLFSGGDNWPRIMTVDRYNECVSSLATYEDAESMVKWLEAVYKMVDSETATGDEKFLYNLENAVDEEVFAEGVYIMRTLSVSKPQAFEDIFDTYLQWTVDDKRAAESEVLADGYEAVMAVVTFTLDISSETPTIERSAEFISPKNNDNLTVPNYEDIELDFE